MANTKSRIIYPTAHKVGKNVFWEINTNRRHFYFTIQYRKESSMCIYLWINNRIHHPWPPFSDYLNNKYLNISKKVNLLSHFQGVLILGFIINRLWIFILNVSQNYSGDNLANIKGSAKKFHLSLNWQPQNGRAWTPMWRHDPKQITQSEIFIFLATNGNTGIKYVSTNHRTDLVKLHQKPVPCAMYLE